MESIDNISFKNVCYSSAYIFTEKLEIIIARNKTNTSSIFIPYHNLLKNNMYFRTKLTIDDDVLFIYSRIDCSKSC